MSFYSNSNVEAPSLGIDISAVMRQVYLWLTLGLALSAGVAYYMAYSGQATRLFTSPGLSIILLIAYIVAAFAVQPVIMRASPGVGAAAFLGFSVLLGIMLSSIFLTYTKATIFGAFAATSATFAAMSVVGYTTKIDLSRFGTYLMMAVIGLFIASIINIFLFSNTLYWIINYAGVLIFTALTAYDTQWIKKYATAVANSDPATIQRVALIGAFHLFLDFINLFLFILRIMGGGRGGRR